MDFSLFEAELYRSGVLTLGVFVAMISVHSSRVIARKKQTADATLASRSDAKLIEGLQCIRRLHDHEQCNLRLYGRQGKATDEDLQRMLYVLNYYEFVSVGIREGIYDDAMWKRAQYSQVTTLWRRVEPLVGELRASRNQPTMFQDFECLATSWLASPLTLANGKRRLWRIW